MRTETFCLLLLFVTSTSFSGQSGDVVERKLNFLDKRYGESLVQITYRQKVSRSTADPPVEAELTTTGVIISQSGIVMTSAIIFEPFNQVPHGVGIRFPASVSRIEATISDARIRAIDGTDYHATLIGRDLNAGVAFFRIEIDGREFVPVSFDDGVEGKVGMQVVVLSLLPEPLGPTIAVELSRIQALVHKPQKGYIVATGTADPVGSLVVSLDGNTLGFMDALTVPVPETRLQNPLAFLSVMRDLPKGVGRGFVRPAHDFVDVSIDVHDTDALRRGWLGIEMQALSAKLSAHMGLSVKSGILVGYVYQDSPAKRAGIEVGDVLIELAGKPIEVSRDEDVGRFAERVLRAGVGAELGIRLIRNGSDEIIVVKLDPAPVSAREAKTLEISELDVVVRALTYDYLARQFLELDQAGVVVVKPPLAVSNNPNRVMTGDLLVRIDDQLIKDLDSLYRLVEEIRHRKPDEVVLFVERGRESFFFAVKPEWN